MDVGVDHRGEGTTTGSKKAEALLSLWQLNQCSLIDIVARSAVPLFSVLLHPSLQHSSHDCPGSCSTNGGLNQLYDENEEKKGKRAEWMGMRPHKPAVVATLWVSPFPSWL